MEVEDVKEPQKEETPAPPEPARPVKKVKAQPANKRVSTSDSPQPPKRTRSEAALEEENERLRRRIEEVCCNHILRTSLYVEGQKTLDIFTAG